MTDLALTVFGYFSAAIVSVGGIGVITWQLFKVFSEKWLDAQFKQKLAIIQHAHAQELEQLRYRINSLFDRTVKLHQREFEVLPDAWHKLVDAYNSIDSLTSPFQQYPDLDKMTTQELNEFLQQTDYTESEQSRIRSSSKKAEENYKISKLYRMSKCREICRTQHVFILQNGIFIPDEIRELFDKIGSATWDAWVEHEISQQYGDYKERTKRQAFQDARQELSQLEKKIKERLASAHMITAEP